MPPHIKVRQENQTRRAAAAEDETTYRQCCPGLEMVEVRMHQCRYNGNAHLPVARTRSYNWLPIL